MFNRSSDLLLSNGKLSAVPVQYIYTNIIYRSYPSCHYFLELSLNEK